MPLSDYVKAPIKLLPTNFTTEAYTMLVEEKDMLTPFVNSIFVTVVGTFLSLCVISSAAYALSRNYLYGRGFLMKLVLIPMLFSGGLIPTYMTMRTLGLLDSLWISIFLPLVSSYYLILMRSYFQGIPDSLEESAKIDGASDFRVFTDIILPVAKPIIATITLFVAVDRWNDVYNNLMFVLAEEKRVLPVVIYRMISTQSDPASQGIMVTGVAPQTQRMAAIVMTTLPILIVYPFLQRHFAKGVMIGSVKG